MIARHGHEPHVKRHASGQQMLGAVALRYAHLETLPDGVSIFKNDEGAVVLREALAATSVNPDPGHCDTIVSAAHDAPTAWYAKFLKPVTKKATNK